MPQFEVQITSAAVIDRFVTVEVADGPNAAMEAKVKALELALNPDEQWTVRGAQIDRLGDPQTVQIVEPAALHGSPSIGEPVEQTCGVEVVKIGPNGFQRLGFWPTEGLSEADENAAYAEAEGLRMRERARCGRGEVVSLRDTFAGAA